jgi:hypothetical protein
VPLRASRSSSMDTTNRASVLVTKMNNTARLNDATSKCESPRHRTEECFRRLSCTERRFSASYAPSSGVAGGRWPYSSPQPTAEVGLYWTEALKETPD